METDATKMATQLAVSGNLSRTGKATGTILDDDILYMIFAQVSSRPRATCNYEPQQLAPFFNTKLTITSSYQELVRRRSHLFADAGKSFVRRTSTASSISPLVLGRCSEMLTFLSVSVQTLHFQSKFVRSEWKTGYLPVALKLRERHKLTHST